jgi:hypothetical protein
MMRAFMQPQKASENTSARRIQPSVPSLAPPSTPTLSPATEIFTGYASDVSEDVPMPEDEPDVTEDEGRGETRTSNAVDDGIDDAIDNLRSSRQHHIRPPPPLKRRRLDVPARVARQKAKEERRKVLEVALQDIEHIIGSKRMKFVAGREGLQAQRARAIQYYLYMVVKNQRKGIDASERAAEVMKLSPSWGGRLVRRWVRQWIALRTLPESKRGQHVKTFSLLEDPAIRAELRSYVRSNKWVIDPAKLVDFSQKKMIPAAADKYLRKLVDNEMPRGLKQYMEVELFPRVQLKVGKGVSLKTARRFLRNEGFRYIEHKKGLYFDGHDS